MSRCIQLMLCPAHKPGRRIGALAGIVLILGVAPRVAGQTEDPAERIVDHGLKVSEVSISETYYKQSVPGGIAAYGDLFLGSGKSVTGAASIKWTRVRAKSFLKLRALPSYGSRFGQLNSRMWNQSASLAYSRLLGDKWSLSLTGTGQVMYFSEALFADTTLTQVASNTISFDDLAGSILRGKSSDPDLNSLAYGSLRPDQNIQTFLYGQRTANFGAQVGLNYAHSPRLSIGFVGGGSLVRHLKDATDISGIRYPKVNTTATGASATYSLSPRMQVGVSVNVVRSDFLHSMQYTTNAFSGSISRTMSRRWFLQASFGYGSENMNGDRHLNNRYSAGLGYKSFSNTLLFSYDRGIDDPYAVTLATLEHTRNLTGNWRYARPGSSWWINSAFSQLIAIYRGVPGTNTWYGSETFGRRISRHYSIVAQFTAGRVGAKRYIQDGRQYQLEQMGFRTTFIWSPQPPSRMQ